jgi:hypothetical protein
MFGKCGLLARIAISLMLMLVALLMFALGLAQKSPEWIGISLLIIGIFIWIAPDGEKAK